MKDLSIELKSLAAKSGDNGYSWLPFWMHSMDTEGIIEKLWDNWLPEDIKQCVSEGISEKAENIAKFLALVHDMGKMTTVFQYRISRSINDDCQMFVNNSEIMNFDDKTIKPGMTRHPLAGEAILESLGCNESIASVVGSHHGKPISGSEAGEESCAEQISAYKHNFYGDGSKKKIWRSLWKEWLNYAVNYAGFESLDDIVELRKDKLVLYSGLIVMADWIASNTEYFPLIDIESVGMMDDYPDRVEKAWNKLSLPSSWVSETRFADQEHFSKTFGFPPSIVQESVMEIAEDCIDPGLFIIEAPMGSGKTEAALGASEIIAANKRLGGLFFGLPTQATANGIFTRLKSWADTQSDKEKHSIKLAHGMASMNKEYMSLFKGKAVQYEDSDLSESKSEGLVIHSFFSGRKQSLLADFVVGTVDQLLMIALKRKHFMLRHLGAAGKVIIIDECHSYDAYMSEFLEETLSWLGDYHVPVILLSATLTGKKRLDFVRAYLNDHTVDSELYGSIAESRGYPLITWIDGNKIDQKEIEIDKKDTEVKISSVPQDDIVDLIQDKLSQGGCAGIVVNTVNYAQELAEKLTGELPEFKVMLFHSRYIQSDRASIEEDVVSSFGKKSSEKSRNGLILIGTQVIEQSLDIDFDIMLTEICPMDLLLQRIGRLHRHHRKRPESLGDAECFVINNEGTSARKGTELIYGKWLLRQTERYLPERIFIPRDIPELVNDTYDIPDVNSLSDDEKDEYAAFQHSVYKEQDKTRNFILEAPDKKNKLFYNWTLDGMMDEEVGSDSQAEAAVRDTDPSFDVIVMMKHRDGRISYLPGHEAERVVERERVPGYDEARLIAGQRIKMPSVLCYPEIIESTIGQLKIDAAELSEWYESPWLAGELFMLVDENCEYRIGGYTLSYDKFYGLKYRKGVDE